MSDEYFLHTILLEDEFVFVHASKHQDFETLKSECELLFDFVKLHKPVSILETVGKISDLALLDFYVKKYMLNYGIQYVRGGSYCDTELPEYLLKTLSTEFETSHNYGIEIQNKYNEIVKCNKVKNSVDQLQKLLDDYIKFKETYNSIKSCTVGEINRDILSEFEWAFDQIRFSRRLHIDLCNFEKDNGVQFHKKYTMENFTFFECDVINKDRYQKVLDYIDFLKKGYKKLNEEKAFEKCDIHTIHANSMYDINGSSYENEIQNTKYLVYYMLNRIEEMEFDLVTTPKGMVQDIKNKIYYMKNMTFLTPVQ